MTISPPPSRSHPPASGSVDRAPTSRRLLDQRTLIDELWRISHFGWIPEAAIQRALTLAGRDEIPIDSLHQGLRELLDRGCLDHRDSDADIGDHHWRLTDTGRHARFS